ncbi:two-component sensor histidine kinase [Desulfosarcina alkanivorans]|uniref:histidine kinase n=1 Tax=Desulfosarcina alkanivorans TaxID=571177 RepID=A0A5K7YJT8_9BACT|nr:cache domain-containing protein [Desulfosarcina alkanivorans]BBO69466.1 two-component sensor histidine kinase [Desulfosarcina alkanivorans]
MHFRLTKIHSIRVKLIISLIAVSLFIGLISLTVGGKLLYQSVIDEANNRVRQDLNVARLIYEERINAVRLALEVIASNHEYSGKGSAAGLLAVAESVDQLSDRLKLDFSGITDARGQVISGSATTAREISAPGPLHPLAGHTLEKRQTVTGTLVMDRDQLMAESPSMADRADITIRSSGKADGAPAHRETSGLTVGAAVPIVVDGSIAAVLYGGFLLNRDTTIVDKIGATVFKNEVYKGRNVGTATIFYKDLRIATSVKDPSGKRALGTLASPQVARHVLEKGEKWTDRARVLDDWTITAYEPIADIAGKRVGMLYVGVLEAKYSDIRRRAIVVFGGITLAGVIIAIALEWLFAGRIMRPVSNLIRASAEISSGNFSPNIGTISRGDIGQLQKKFLIMAGALKEREERQRAESETRLIQSEKQASVGKLAAGVAHEINNPLTAVLTFTHLILRRKDLPAEVRSDLETVAAQTERVRGIVKSLLDFSRQTEISTETVNINSLVEDSVGLMKNQALIKDVHLSFKGEAGLPALTLDRNQFQSVLINMIINALDATPSAGKIEIRTTRADHNDAPGVEIRIADNGSGISPEHMDQLFDPFFTTKAVGKGTGLGLAVSAGIIQRHGGTINVRSRLESGTTFTIWLPRQQVKASAPPAGSREKS